MRLEAANGGGRGLPTVGAGVVGGLGYLSGLPRAKMCQSRAVIKPWVVVESQTQMRPRGGEVVGRCGISRLGWRRR